MLTLDQLSAFFPPALAQKNPEGILVEYLQHELLDSIFKNKASGDLAFIGGTAIRVLYSSPRFSEDLDFDNFGLPFKQFESLLTAACKDMTYRDLSLSIVSSKKVRTIVMSSFLIFCIGPALARWPLGKY